MCTATIQNNTIASNSGYLGGGLCDCGGTIQNNTIMGNSATGDYSRGGGLYGCDGAIQNNTIVGNSAGYSGGGLDRCNGTIRNNTITANSAACGGGLYDCGGIIQNNTITGNSATYARGGLDACNGAIQNCIIWGNTAPSGPQLYRSSIPTYSCIEGWTWGGERNIAADPLFVDAQAHDYRLQVGSPCIDAGKNEDWLWTVTDLDGNPRVWNGTVDMGAYEYGSWLFSITRVIMTGTGALQLTWTSRPPDEYAIWSCDDLSSANWTQEQTVPSAGDFTSWTDPSPGGSRKFYRVERF